MLYTRSDGGLRAIPSGHAISVGVWSLLGHSIADDDLLGCAFAWVIGEHCNPGTKAFVPRLGMGKNGFARLIEMRFHHFAPPKAWLEAQDAAQKYDGALAEFPDLLALLLEHRAAGDEHHLQVAHLVATACMGSDHLWQDLGLPDRHALSELLRCHFPRLAARNTGDMKWKKFFYKQLCEREEIAACKSPNCTLCADHENCFGAET